jgi:hypothetical protein
MCTASKQASKQSKAKSKIKRVSRLCKSQDYLLISRLQNFPLCIDDNTTKMWCAGKSNSSLTVYAGQQPPPSLTQPTPSRKHPRCICPQALQISIRKKLSQVFQKHPRCLQISIKKRSFPKCCRNAQDVCKSQNIYSFQVF